MKSKIIVGLALLLCSLAVRAQVAEKKWQADLETGLVFSGTNDVRIPNQGGTLFSFSRDLTPENRAYARLRLSYRIGRRHTLSALFAPLTIRARGTLGNDLFFQDQLFPAGSTVTGSYTFNSYRFSYRYHLIEKPTFRLSLGFTAKIRDAEITVRSATQTASKPNVGFVPLLNLFLHWQWSETWGLQFEADALAVPGGQGRAEDVQLALTYRLNSTMRLRAGYRFVEGGADVPEVYNFAWIHYLSLGLSVSF